ncbi:MAG TPA: hypothetical protein VIL46_08540, partial [Gemmataceae bacterium]
MRRRLRRHSARLLRPGVVVSLLLGHALTALGLPLPRPVPAASAATPSPCGPRACGCLIAPGSPEPCCCSTGRKAAPMPEPALGAAAGGCCAAGAGRTAPDPARPHCARAPD